MTKLYFIAILVSALITPALHAENYAVGNLESDFQVALTGAASYNIPISVPPGTAGMAPLLTISYLSQRGNGLLGIGFALDGLTAIARGHGENQDQFYLNGESINSLPSNTKIVAIDPTENGPTKFKVWTANGQIAEYGFTEDSKIPAQGKSTIAVWALNKISDTLGNYLTIFYDQDKTNGVFYPVTINYTGNENAKAAPYNEVRFLYQTRPDLIEFKEEESVIRVNKRLSEIQIFCEQKLLYKYQFTYEQSPSTNLSRLLSIQKCAASGSCFPPTRFAWQRFFSTKKIPDLISSITDGFGVNLNILYAAKYLIPDQETPLYVATQTKNSATPDAIHYDYEDAKVDQISSKFFGFKTMKVTDNATGIAITTTYSQDETNHLIGKILKSETRSTSGSLISSTENTWDYVNRPENIYTKKIVNRNLLSTKTTEIKVDDFLNPIRITINTEDKSGTYTTTTVNEYRNDHEKWLLGMLTKSSVTAGASNAIPITKTSSYKYDLKTGILLESTTEPEDPKYQLSTNYEHDIFGNIIKTTISGSDIASRTTHQTFDGTGRFAIKSENALGHVPCQITDPRFGKPTKTTDANGMSTIYEYDEFGRTIAINYPDGTKSKINYAWVYQKPINAIYSVTNKDTSDRAHTIYYDVQNREIAKTKQSLNGRIIWETVFYDTLGRVSQKSQPYFAGCAPQFTHFRYDALGRLITTTHPNRTTTRMEYDGPRTTIINALGQQNTKVTNARGELLESIDNLKQSVYYQYDASGNVIKIKDSTGNITKIGYDKLGRRIWLQCPDKGYWTYTYNAFNELTSQTDAINQTTSFQYDQLGRMIKRADNAGTSSWEYDTAPHGVGKLATVSSITSINGQAPNGTDLIRAIDQALLNEKHTYFYDELSRPIKTVLSINGNNYISSISYDHKSRPYIETFPSSLAIKNHYDDFGFLFRIDNAKNGERYWELNAADAAGHTLKETHHNGLITNYEYDPKTNYLTSIETSKARQNLHYTYDAIGNIKSRRDLVNHVMEDFAYDALNRLILHTDWKGRKTIWQYDTTGNITFKSDVGKYIYGEHGAGPHAVTSVIGDKQNAHFFYDQNGDQIKADINGVPRNLHYTSYNKPFFLSNNQGLTAFYYNADREHFARVDKSTDGKTVTTFYLGDFELVTYQDQNTYFFEEKHYIGPSTLYIHHEDKKGSYNKILTLLHDNLNSVTDITDEKAELIAHFYFDPFGAQKQTYGDKNKLSQKGFTNHETVALFNLIHMSGRIYDPIFGRFLSADPLVQNPEDMQSLNRYSYCINNPLRYTDPSGYSFLSGVVRGVGGLIHGIGSGVCKIIKGQDTQKLLIVACGVLSANAAWYALPLFSSSMTAISGGNFSDIMKSAAIAFAEVEVWSINYNLTSSFNKTSNMLIHGGLGGGLSTMSGGNFQDGFVSAAITEGASGWVNKIEKDSMYERAIMKRAAASGIVGGTASTLSHGNFMNGAETAAFSRMFSEEAKLFLELHSNQYKTQKELENIMGPNAIIFADVALDAMPGHIMVRDWFLNATHLALAHKEPFFTDENGHLSHLGFNGFASGLHPDERFNANNLSVYYFGPISKNVQVTDSVLYQSSYLNPKSYNLFLHNCQHYADSIRRRLQLPREAI